MCDAIATAASHVRYLVIIRLFIAVSDPQQQLHHSALHAPPLTPRNRWKIDIFCATCSFMNMYDTIIPLFL